jgi:hypothetical protein
MNNEQLIIENHKRDDALSKGQSSQSCNGKENCLVALLLGLAAVGFLSAKEIGAQSSAQSMAKLTGRVTVAGGYVPPKPLPVFKNRDFCGPRVANETVLIGRDGGLRNAVVILRPFGRPMASRPQQIVLDNQHCAFVPHVQVTPVGSELLLKNSDPILHTVHARLGRETLFNVGLPKWRQVTKRLDRSGVVRIDCDVLHTWMSAAIVVSDSPYYGVSDEQGKFAIEVLSAGDYEAEVWHERLGIQKQILSLREAESIHLDIVYGSYGP